VSGDERHLRSYRVTVAALGKSTPPLRELLAESPAQQLRFDRVVSLINQRLQTLNHIVEVRREHGFVAGVESVQAGHGEGLMDAIQHLIGEMRDEETKAVRQREREARTKTKSTLFTLSFAALLGFSLLLLVFYTLTRQMRERERAQAALRQSEEHSRSLIENALDLVALLDENGTIRYASPSHQRVLGYRAADLVGQNAFALVHPDDRAEVHNAFTHALQHPGDSAAMEFRYRHNDGSWRVLEGIGNNLLDHPAIAGFVVNSRDVTERKRAEEEARQRQTELAHVLRVGMMGEMAAGLAHEINQPLAAIVNYASGCARRLRAETGADTPLVGAMEEITKQAARAEQIIRRLRTFVRKREFRREPVDLNNLVRDVARFVRSEAHHHGISVRLDLAPALPRVHADGIQIEQVIVNLVRNGIDAMHAADLGHRVLSIHTSADRPEVVEVAVCDGGTGVDGAHAEKLFEPFFTTKPNGLGMGLSISRSIVTAHGGRLWAAPNPDRGTTFRFTLPVANGGRRDAV
jgi:two-component system sensor kinase FixL